MVAIPNFGTSTSTTFSTFSLSYSDVLSYTFAAVDQAANAAYVVFWGGAFGINSAATDYLMRVIQAGSAVVTTNAEAHEEFGSASAPIDRNQQAGFFFFTAAATPADVTFKIQLAIESSGTASCFNSMLRIVKLPVNSAWAESLAESTNSTTTYTDKISLGSALSGDNLLLVSAEDATAAATNTVEVAINTDAVVRASLRSSPSDITNYTTKMVAFRATTGATTAKVQFRSSNTSAAKVRNVRFLALKATDFRNIFFGRLAADSTGTQTTYTTALTLTQTVSAGDHLLIAPFGMHVASTSESVFARLTSGGTQIDEAIREPNSATVPVGVPGEQIMRLENYSAGSRTWTLDRKSALGTSHRLLTSSSIAVLDLEAPSPGVFFVGSTTATKAGAASGNSTITLSGLTGGTRPFVREGDLVIGVYASGSTTDRSLTISDGTTDYNLIGSELYSGDAGTVTRKVNLRVAYKFMGTTPDASTTFGPTTNIDDAGSMAVFVFSGVDQTTPLDVAVTTALGLATGQADPPSITPTTTGAVVLALGAVGATTGAVFTSSDLSGFASATSVGLNDSILGGGYINWTGGAVDPAQFGGGTVASSDSWAAMSIALRPAGVGGGSTNALTASTLTSSAPSLGTPSPSQTHGLVPSTLTSTSPALGTPAFAQIAGLTATSLTGGTPDLGGPLLGVVSNLTGSALSTGSPTLGSPAVGQVHGVLASGLTAAPSLGSPSFASVHGLVASGLVGASPVLGSPSFATVATLAAAGIVASPSDLGTPQIGQTHSIAIEAVASPAPSLESPSVGQSHSFSATGLTSSPALGTPAIAQVHDVLPSGLVGAAPEIGIATVGQAHTLTATAISASAPTIGAPQFFENTSGLQALTLGAGVPSLGSPTLSTFANQVSLTASGITATPSLGTPALVQVHVLTATGIETQPTIGAPALVHRVGLTATGISAGTPSLERSTLAQVHRVTATVLVSGTPVVGSPAIAQRHLLAANDVEAAPTLGAPVFTARLDMSTPPSRTTSAPARMGATVATARSGSLAPARLGATSSSARMRTTYAPRRIAGG